jgi:addiction module antitoxin, RelB/DinJ family
MMNKTQTIRARVAPNLKERAESILDTLGLNASQAITLFYRQIELRNGLPFEVTLPPAATPNALTAKTLKKSARGKNLVVCKDADDMCAKLGI